ncbi:MAG: ATP-binding protein [Planctomycetota bacterium]|nr:ATP-binding protein [Planctomycetota bacterium]
MLALEVIRGVDQGRIFPLPEGEPQLLGRSSESLPLTDQSVSRRHAELTPDGESWWLRDLRSANGTWINGRRVEERVVLRPGDEITCGETILRFIQTDRLISGPAGWKEPSVDIPAEGTVALSEREPELPGTLEAAQARLRMLESLSTLAVSASEPSELIEQALDMLISEFSPGSAFVLLSTDAQSTMSLVGRRGSHPAWSDTIVRRIKASCCPLLVSDAATDLRFKDDDSIRELGLRSVMAAPLQVSGSVFGVVLLDDRQKPSHWDEEDIRLLSAVSKQISLAIVNADVAANQLQQARLISMGETVATISHAVKNIMQGLRGGAGAIELALSRGDLDMALEAWPILSRNLDRIHDLTFNMLAWSRSASLETEPVQVGPIFKEAIDLLGVQCRHRKVKILLEGTEDLPPIPVDASALHQAILNLLTNAIEAVPAKTGQIRVALSVDEDCHWMICSVEDNGDGVELERQLEIFQPFTSSKGQRGTGLGLAVTRKIAEEHGGTLELDPEFKAGARFQLRVPLGREGDPGDTDTPRVPDSKPPSPGEFDE